MMTSILIAIAFSAGFFVESIVGFGGGLIAYAILGFFMDLKEMIIAGLYIGTCSSSYIIYTDRKSFDKKVFQSLVPLSLLGTVVGVFVFAKLSSALLALVFGILLIALAVKIMFFEKLVFPKILKKKLIFLGGIAQGSFGIGGPFWVNALAKDFKNKSTLRTTMAACFVSFNLVRVFQLSAQNQINLEFFAGIWWAIIPVFITIKLGHFVHLKISEGFFKKMIAVMTVMAGINFLSKFIISLF